MQHFISEILQMFKSIDPEKKHTKNQLKTPQFVCSWDIVLADYIVCHHICRNENAYDTDTIQHTAINIYTYVIVYVKHERNKSRGQHPNYELYTKFKPIT